MRPLRGYIGFMTIITDQKHRSAVANFLAGKLREFGYQLDVIVKACDEAAELYEKSKLGSDGAVVVYGFSAFTNAMQSLKDAVTTIAPSPVTWAEIGALPHGTFVAKARNAATHDGNPIVNAWVDGRFFVANNIDRLDMRGEPIEIVRPEEDVRTICLRFALGFANLLRDRLTPLVGQFSIAGAPFDGAEFAEIIRGSPLIPEAVKRMVADKLGEITDAIENAPPIDPVEKAITELGQLASRCSERLNSTSQ